jgi:hypothetical protein
MMKSHRDYFAGLILCAIIASVIITACRSPRESRSGEFESWPAADRVFRQDRLWRGGDAAYSADLGEGRVLWLFGDSFVGDGEGDTRSGRRMVRNSIAVQHGYDPSRATIEFFHDATGEEPAAFFAGNGDEWLWPGPAQKVGPVVLMMFTRLEKHGEGIFGFRAVGSEARFLLNPSQPPAEWNVKSTPLPDPPAGVKLSTGALLLHEGFLYAYPVVEPGSHDVQLARWHEDDVAALDLTQPRWWTGSGWSSKPGDAAAIVRNLQTEFSVARGKDGLFRMVSVDGFGATNIVARTAPAPQGPWSEPRILFRPPESSREFTFVYSAKEYPHDRGQAFVLTYCTNHHDFWTMAGDMGLYFPRFVKVSEIGNLEQENEDS